MAEPVIAEFDSPEGAVHAATRLRALGYADLEGYTPFPVPELQAALGVPRSRLAWSVFAAGAAGCALAYAVLWYTNAVDYPLDVGARPLSSIPTHVPIMFETTVLFAAVTAFAAALLLSGLPRLHHRVFELEGFERTTLDRFWIVIGDAHDAQPDVLAEELASLRAELAQLGACAVHGLAEESS